MTVATQYLTRYVRADAFSAYQTATGGVPDNNTGLLKITADQFAALESLFFNIGDVSII